jgi:hypothetical protein
MRMAEFQGFFQGYLMFELGRGSHGIKKGGNFDDKFNIPFKNVN